MMCASDIFCALQALHGLFACTTPVRWITGLGSKLDDGGSAMVNKAWRSEEGMSMIEMMIAIAFFSVGALSLASTMVVSIRVQTENRDQTVAVNIALNTLESIRALTYRTPAVSSKVSIDDNDDTTEPLQEFYKIFATGTEVKLVSDVPGNFFFVRGTETIPDSFGRTYEAQYLEDPFGNRLRLLGMDLVGVSLTLPAGLDETKIGDSELALPVIITVKWKIDGSGNQPDLRTYKLSTSLYQTYQ